MLTGQASDTFLKLRSGGRIYLDTNYGDPSPSRQWRRTPYFFADGLGASGFNSIFTLSIVPVNLKGVWYVGSFSPKLLS